MPFALRLTLFVSNLLLFSQTTSAQDAPTEETPWSSLCRPFVQVNYHNCNRVRFLKCSDLPEHNRVRETTLGELGLSQFARIEHYIENNEFIGLLGNGSHFRESETSRRDRSRMTVENVPLEYSLKFDNLTGESVLIVEGAIEIDRQPRVINGTEVLILTDVNRETFDGYKGEEATFTKLYSPEHQILISSFGSPDKLADQIAGILTPGDAGFNEKNNLPACLRLIRNVSGHNSQSVIMKSTAIPHPASGRSQDPHLSLTGAVQTGDPAPRLY